MVLWMLLAVLILVLVEHTLRERAQGALEFNELVLILVLVEHTLRVLKQDGNTAASTS